MQFTPKSEKEISEMGLLPAGIYPFEVANATEGRSKAGNDMLIVELIVHTPDGGTRKLTDYLLEALAYKLHSFCRATGLMDAYQSGALSAERCLGRSGYLKIKVEAGRPKDGGGEWPAKNVVTGYDDRAPERKGPLEPSSSAPLRSTPPPRPPQPIASAAAAAIPEDDVPF